MALQFIDRVRVLTQTTGTGTITLGSAVVGYQTFSGMTSGNTCYYAIEDAGGTWEVGLGTYSSTGPTLARTTVIASSNSNAAISLSGTAQVFVTWTASAVALYATLASPGFTGTPTAPTAANGVYSTQLATTAFATTVGITGVSSYGVTGGGFTATAAVYSVPTVQINGALTSNQTVTMPSSGTWSFINSSTGPYTMLVKGSVGGVLVYQSSQYFTKLAVLNNYVIPSIGDATGPNCIGRNKFNNAMFRVAQRGTGAFTAVGYTIDQWYLNFTLTGGSASVSQYAMTDADRAAIGDEEARYGLSAAITVGTGTTDFSCIQQPIEDVYRTSNKIVTISFWAKASVALTASVGGYQTFGTGGSPSANVTLGGVTLALTTTWQRYSANQTIASVAGRTFGTAGNHALVLQIFLSSSSGNTTSGFTTGTSGTVTLWGVQAEIGYTATPLEKSDWQTDLLRCLRYYNAIGGSYGGYQAASGVLQEWVGFPEPMRVAPTVTYTAGTATNVKSQTAGSITTFGYVITATATSAGTVSSTYSFTATAEL